MTTSDYIQRPEVLESNFYAWRATGNTEYLDRAASAVASFEKWLKLETNSGYVGLWDVNNLTSSDDNKVNINMRSAFYVLVGLCFCPVG